MMRQSLEQYRQAIQDGRVNPMRRWDGKTSGLVFDPADQDVPLTHMAFGAYCLDAGAVSGQSGANEGVLVPICGNVRVRAGDAEFSTSRLGGPFAALPTLSNASAIYVPRDCEWRVDGEGELIGFWGPATADKPAAVVESADRENVPRGSATWLRLVITLATPDDVTTNLVVGETYSPPSLWSGTPLHVHDADDPAGGQSDHEEVYYHVARVTEGKWGAYGAQLLFDDAGLDKAYMIHDRGAFAIPGAAHPVVAGPMSDMLYVWGLCGRPGASGQLGMFDVPEFAYLKAAGQIIDQLNEAKAKGIVTPHQLLELASRHNLTREQIRILAMHLRSAGYDVRCPDSHSGD